MLFISTQCSTKDKIILNRYTQSFWFVFGDVAENQTEIKENKQNVTKNTHTYTSNISLVWQSVFSNGC